MKTGLDLLALAGRYTTLKWSCNTRGGQYVGPCPRCGGTDRFIVEPMQELWTCRGCQHKAGKQHWQDIPAFLMFAEGIDFQAAKARLEQLGGRIEAPSRPPIRPPSVSPLDTSAAAFTQVWQSNAVWFAEEAEARLWSAAGQRALDWLIETRKLHPNVIRRMRLGYHNGEERETWGKTPVYLPRAIVIPWWSGGTIQKINLRPPEPIGGRKYTLVSGSANGIYNLDALNGWSPVIMVEGEMNALAILSATDEFIPVATGAVSWGRAFPWVVKLAAQPEIILAFDQDEAGRGCTAWWQDHLPHAETIDLPEGVKDANELAQHDPQGIVRWLERFSVRAENRVSEALKIRIREEMAAAGWQLTPITV